MILKINKRLLKEEECLVRLHANMKKYDKAQSVNDELNKALSNLRTDMAKSACEMQHNEVVLEETRELISNRRTYLENLHKDLVNEEQEHEMLQALLYAQSQEKYHQPSYKTHYTKELLDTLV